MKYCKKLFYVIAIIYFPLVLAIAAVIPTNSSLLPLSYGWNLLVTLFITFPLYMASLEILRIILHCLNRKKYSTLRIVLDGLEGLLALLCCSVFWNLSLALGCSALMLLLWAIDAILMKTKPSIPNEWKQKSFWLFTLISFIIVCLVICGSSFVIEFMSEKPDIQ